LWSGTSAPLHIDDNVCSRARRQRCRLSSWMPENRPDCSPNSRPDCSSHSSVDCSKDYLQSDSHCNLRNYPQSSGPCNLPSSPPGSPPNSSPDSGADCFRNYPPDSGPGSLPDDSSGNLRGYFAAIPSAGCQFHHTRPNTPSHKQIGRRTTSRCCRRKSLHTRSRAMLRSHLIAARWRHRHSRRLLAASGTLVGDTSPISARPREVGPPCECQAPG